MSDPGNIAGTATMSDTATSDTGDAILEAVASKLVWLFRDPDESRQTARTAALQAIAACNPQTPLECLLVGRMLALSLSAIDAAGKAATPGCPDRLRLQYLTKTNTLSRQAQQAEAEWARLRVPPRPQPQLNSQPQPQRQTQKQPEKQPKPQPQTAPPKPQAVPSQPRPATPGPAVPRPAAPPPADAALQALLDLATAAATRPAPAAAPLTASSAPRSPSFRESLLQRTAMPR